MKLRQIEIHNFRSILHADMTVQDYMLLVGANNAGKSTILSALRVFYEDMAWNSDDFPKIGAEDNESWVQLTFQLDENEWENLNDKYKQNVERRLTVRRCLKSDEHDRVKAKQPNIYGVVNGKLEKDPFYGAKNISSTKLGQVIYVPALTTPSEQTKTSGASPLRDMLNFLLKKVVAKSDSFRALEDAFSKLNLEARGQNGFLSEIATPLNTAFSPWSIRIDLSVKPVKPEDISKSLIGFSFVDAALGEKGLELDRYGHGFQRTVIYELIRLAPTFRDEKKAEKKEFDPAFTLILFEEPEAFLHPSQQECMSYHLRRLAKETDQQVIITTHSPVFVGKAADEIGQLIRVRRENGITHTFQPKDDQIKGLFERGGDLLQALRDFVADAAIPDNKKAKARKMVANPPTEDIALQEERFRLQLWLDGDRASLFFADRVLLVEGPTERALFNYLLANEWHDFSFHRIYIVDVFGKCNFHRFIGLLEAYGIPHGIMLDDDNDDLHHGALNELVEERAKGVTLATPVKFNDCLETFLNVPKTQSGRDDRKQIEIMKAITGKTIQADRLDALRENFKAALAL